LSTGVPIGIDGGQAHARHAPFSATARLGRQTLAPFQETHLIGRRQLDHRPPRLGPAERSEDLVFDPKFLGAQHGSLLGAGKTQGQGAEVFRRHDGRR